MPSILELSPVALLGNLSSEDAASLDGATAFVATHQGDGLSYSFAPGALADFAWLSADFLVGGTHLTVFQLRLRQSDSDSQSDSDAVFEWRFGFLNGCQGRLRLPLDAVDQNRWMYAREGAYLKPICDGKRVDLAKVDRLELLVLRKSEAASRFCLTPLTASRHEPAKLVAPLLPNGPLLDEFGQSTLCDWPGKTGGEEELLERLQTQRERAAEQHWPASFSKWGGDGRQKLQATGWFRTQHDGARWWLVDPDGHPFWSAGMDCVAPNIETPYSGLEAAFRWLPPREGDFAAAFEQTAGRGEAINYLAANFLRAFGPDGWRAAWAEIALGHLAAWGFNTVANWSDWPGASAAGFPYVRPLTGRFPATPLLYRDFPDVFDPAFAADAAAFASQLNQTKDDPALIGYFLMNEPTWGFAQETPAQGMMFNTKGGAARQALARWLREKYAGEAELQGAWGDATFDEIETGAWTKALNSLAQQDLAAFSGILVERFFTTLSQACRAVDPHHLNLGVRYQSTPPSWCLEGMKTFDVFSMNCYSERIPDAKIAHIAALLQLPVLIGEWHFGALDAGLPGGGICHVRSQQDRGRAFRVYTETAAAHPACVGVHYFTLYDQSATGRFDGENYNIGFFDVCNRPYAPLTEAARAAHGHIYEVAAGHGAPFVDAPDYLPRLFL